MKQKFLVRSLVAAGVLVAAVGGYVNMGVGFANDAKPAPAITQAAAPSLPATSATMPSFNWIVEKYGPAVVNVSVTGEARDLSARAPKMPQIDPDDPMFEFFKRFGIPGQGGPMPRNAPPSHGVGSGFIVSADGVILTNAHEVDGAKEVDVRLTDKREFRAKVIGVDKQTDVAVIKIEAKNLPTVALGNTADLKVGDWVLAIGSPFGFDNTVTAGIVSAKSRTLPDGSYVPFLQTDVAVNPGNSGGPLFNLKGEVVGINSQIYSQSGGYQGLSFAIPIDVAAKVQTQLVQYGRVERGRLGITIQEVNQSLAESFGLSKPMGALVSAVEKGSPAEKAGVEPGDVIVKINGKEVASSAALPLEVAEIKPGNVAKLEVIRKGDSKTLDVTVGQQKDAKVAAKSGDGADKHERLGLAVRPLNPSEQKEADVKGGLLVEDVSGSGPAARAGIQPGDVILSLNGTPVTSVDQLRELTQKAGKNVALLVQRNDTRLFVPLTIG